MVILVPVLGYPRAFAFDPQEHAITGLDLDIGAVTNFRRRVLVHLPDAQGLALGFLGDVDLAESMYSAPESLLWRDAGAALQTIAMTACAEGLTFCPLGCHAEELATAVRGTGYRLALGAAVLGS
jgi:hypothetical protein